MSEKISPKSLSASRVPTILRRSALPATFWLVNTRPDDMAVGQQLERLIQREIAALDEEHRLLVVLRDIQGLSYQEIGEVTGLNIGTIKSRLHRARLALKTALARHR